MTEAGESHSWSGKLPINYTRIMLMHHISSFTHKTSQFLYCGYVFFRASAALRNQSQCSEEKGKMVKAMFR